MTTHHCCDPAHADYAERQRRLVDRLHEAEARATFAEANEATLADRLEELRDRLAAR